MKSWIWPVRFWGRLVTVPGERLSEGESTVTAELCALSTPLQPWNRGVTL